MKLTQKFKNISINRKQKWSLHPNDDGGFIIIFYYSHNVSISFHCELIL